MKEATLSGGSPANAAAPDQLTLALLAALIAPVEAVENPIEALTKAARLWGAAGAFAEDSLRHVDSGKKSVESKKEFQWWGSQIQVGEALLEFVNSALPNHLQYKTLRNLQNAMGLKQDSASISAMDAALFASVRVAGATEARTKRRNASKRKSSRTVAGKPGQNVQAK